MTKQDLIARMQRLVDNGTVAPHAVDNVRLDDIADAECLVDMFGEDTPEIDCALDRFVDVWPTGHRTTSERVDCHFMDLGDDYILD